jgi:hypothetical protein
VNTDNALERAYAHWYEDGFAEISLGIFFVAIGAWRAAIQFVTDKSLTYYLLAGGLLIVFLSYGWVASRAVRALKTRVSYPRTGYVAYKPRKPKRKRLVLILLFGGVLGGVLGILSSQPDARLVEAFVPIAMGGPASWLARSACIPRLAYPSSS